MGADGFDALAMPQHHTQTHSASAKQRLSTHSRATYARDTHPAAHMLLILAWDKWRPSPRMLPPCACKLNDEPSYLPPNSASTKDSMPNTAVDSRDFGMSDDGRDSLARDSSSEYTSINASRPSVCM